MKKLLSIFTAFSLLAVVLVTGITGCTADSGSDPLKPQERLQVATTTSLYDTGLWGYLEPMFEEKYGIEVDVLYAGTGIAIEYGQRGDVDVITVHSKSRELAYVEEGYGVGRGGADLLLCARLGRRDFLRCRPVRVVHMIAAPGEYRRILVADNAGAVFGLYQFRCGRSG